MVSPFKATLIGLAAPVLWGMSVGLVRSICETFGFALGLLLAYGIAFIGLLLLFGIPKISKYPWKYRIFGITSANVCAICFCTSLALSDGGSQTMEVGMVNYLWPCLTVVFAILFNGQKAKWWVVPGFVLCLAGIVIVLSGDTGFDLSRLIENVSKNPLSYLLALAGAIAWSGYNSMTRAWAQGQNPTVIIFFNDVIMFGALALFMPAQSFAGGDLSWTGLAICVLCAVVMGGGYACWNVGAMYGNLTLMAIASYFTPVLSCLFATMWIGADLSFSFWQGVGLVVAGSLLCWAATRERAPVPAAKAKSA